MEEEAEEARTCTRSAEQNAQQIKDRCAQHVFSMCFSVILSFRKQDLEANALASTVKLWRPKGSAVQK